MKNKMRIVLYSILTFMFIAAGPAAVVAQQSIMDATNTGYLKNLASSLKENYKKEKAEAERVALERNIPVRSDNTKGPVFEIQRITETGSPIYYKTYNVEAAVTTGTDLLQKGGELAFNLTGNGYQVNVWDGGSINDEHQELAGRVLIQDDTPFGTHDTHVAGTIAAAGIDPDAKGMAFESNLVGYDFNDDNAEMADEAAEGLLISNHSYGLRSGWEQQEGGGWQWFGDRNISEIEDYKFGYYSSNESRVWDDIVYNAPYYTIVKAAGNDRTDDGGDNTSPPADGPYDIIGPKGVAKNIITVGAVEAIAGGYSQSSDAVMSEFSSWGPTDDGRVKPDLVAAGVNIYSSISEGPQAYGELSGTSMASPNVTGSLVLLQELYSQVNAGNHMKAATLKGLAIHSVHETGNNAGPDYEFGWGLLSTDRAGNVIRKRDGENFILKELKLDENRPDTTFTVTTDGTAPLIATICWTDVPGNPVGPSLDPSERMLVNDLDIRIRDTNDKEYQPWILDPSRPQNSATTGDNDRDNVEKIQINNPDPGTYTISVSHKGTLENDVQDFSLIVTTKSMEESLDAYYWIGDSGNWDDPTNWSNNSGGSPAGDIPGINNPVIFDENSFSSANPTINLNDNESSFAINWYAKEKASVELNGNTLLINGSMFIENDSVSFRNGTLRFNGQQAKGNAIRAPQNTLSEVDLQINGENAGWNLLTNLATQNLSVEKGNLSVVGKTINASSISSVTANNTRSVNFRNSLIRGFESISFGPGLETKLKGANFEVDAEGGTPVAFNGGGNQFFNLLVKSGEVTLNGNNTFNRIDLNGTMTINGNNTLDSLSLAAGSSLTLQDGSTQEINQSFSGTGDQNNIISLQSGGEAFFNADNASLRFCFDFLDIKGVSVTGATDFIAGDNSTIGSNSSGWLAGDCADALFADFNARRLCRMGYARFEDQSTGEPQSWKWNFGDPQFPESNTSTARNPEHMYHFTGTYEVTLEVSDGEDTKTLVRTINVTESEDGLTQPEITINGRQLVTSEIAPQYQWFFEGQPIDGATNRTFSIDEGGDYGQYSVAVENQRCRFVSEPTVVTSAGEKLNREEAGSSAIVFPNPGSGLFTLYLTNEYLGKVDFAVRNTEGKMVDQFTMQKDASRLEADFDLLGQSEGIYLLQIQMQDRKITRKIIKTQ